MSQLRNFWIAYRAGDLLSCKTIQFHIGCVDDFYIRSYTCENLLSQILIWNPWEMWVAFIRGKTGCDRVALPGLIHSQRWWNFNRISPGQRLSRCLGFFNVRARLLEAHVTSVFVCLIRRTRE